MMSFLDSRVLHSFVLESVMFLVGLVQGKFWMKKVTKYYPSVQDICQMRPGIFSFVNLGFLSLFYIFAFVAFIDFGYCFHLIQATVPSDLDSDESINDS